MCWEQFELAVGYSGSSSSVCRQSTVDHCEHGLFPYIVSLIVCILLEHHHCPESGLLTFYGHLLLPLSQIGKGRILREGTDVALLGYGTMSLNCLQAASILAERSGVTCTVADGRFCKPLDRDLIRQLARHHSILVVVEEGSMGGFSAHVQHFMALDGLLDDGKVKVSEEQRINGILLSVN